MRNAGPNRPVFGRASRCDRESRAYLGVAFWGHPGVAWATSRRNMSPAGSGSSYSSSRKERFDGPGGIGSNRLRSLAYSMATHPDAGAPHFGGPTGCSSGVGSSTSRPSGSTGTPTMLFLAMSRPTKVVVSMRRPRGEDKGRRRWDVSRIGLRLSCPQDDGARTPRSVRNPRGDNTLQPRGDDPERRA